MHANWLKKKSVSANLTNGCRSGRAVQLQHRSGRQVPVTLSIRELLPSEIQAQSHQLQQGRGTIYAVKVIASSLEAIAFESTMSLKVRLGPGRRCTGPDILRSSAFCHHLQVSADSSLKMLAVRCSERSFGFRPAQIEERVSCSFTLRVPTSAAGPGFPD